MSNVPLGYLRTFLTLLVVAHHAVLAYHPYAPPRPKSLGESMIWGAFPVVDTARWPGTELFVGFNDTFFMSLMFLISGVFAWSSLERKSGRAFFGERARKLGVAFAFSAVFLAPLAYYPTYLSLEPQTTSFMGQWLGLDAWPAGPAWFLWVLLALAGVAAAGASPAAERLPGWAASASGRPSSSRRSWAWPRSRISPWPPRSRPSTGPASGRSSSRRAASSFMRSISSSASPWGRTARARPAVAGQRAGAPMAAVAVRGALRLRGEPGRVRGLCPPDARQGWSRTRGWAP